MSRQEKWRWKQEKERQVEERPEKKVLYYKKVFDRNCILQLFIEYLKILTHQNKLCWTSILCNISDSPEGSEQAGASLCIPYVGELSPPPSIRD